ncbi:DUF2254 family protein [Thermoproteota archaeon]
MRKIIIKKIRKMFDPIVKLTRLEKIAFIVVFFWMILSHFFPTPLACSSEARSILIALIGILATILAISVSLLVVSMEFVSETYTPRILTVMFEDKLFTHYVAAYTITILLTIFVLGFDFNPQSFLPYAYLFFIVCFFYLLIFLFHAKTFFHPSYILSRLKNKIPNDFPERIITRIKEDELVFGSEDEPIIATEQILIRAVVQNDYLTFLAGIEFIESILRNFLYKIENQLKNETQKSNLREKPSEIFTYFLRIYRQILSECLLHSREEHLARLTRSLRRLMVQLHNMSAFRAFDWTAELFDTAGFGGVDKKLQTFLEGYYVRDLEKIVNTQISIFSEKLYPFDDLDKWNNLSEEERSIRIDNEVLSWSAQNRIQFLSDFVINAAKQRLESIVSYCMHIFSNILDNALSLQHIQKKRFLVADVIRILVNTHKKCVDKGVNSTTFTTSMLHYKIKNMKDQTEVSEFGLHITNAFASMSRYSINNGFYREIWHWGINGRFLIKNYPELANIAIDLLSHTLDFLNSKPKKEIELFYEQALQELRSLRDWESHPHIELQNKIDEILKKYPD